MGFKLNREKYLRIAKEEGVSIALTEIMHRLKELEQQCFEGANGYDPKLYENMKKLREVSREIWTLHHRYETANDVVDSLHRVKGSS